MKIKIPLDVLVRIKKIANDRLWVFGREPYDNVTPLSSCEDYDNIIKDIINLEEEEVIVKAAENGLYGFETVGMHVDAVTPPNCFVMMVPVLGNGEFYHYGIKKDIKGEIYENSINSNSCYQQSAIIFNDLLPHCFIAKSNCLALLYPIPYSIVDKIVKRNIDIIT